MIEAQDIWVQGIVQGVGFRPFVYRMAKKYLINGWVLNASDGVHIHAEGEGKLLEEFVLELSDNAPAAAQVKQIDLKDVPLEGFDSFEIRFSDAAEVEQTTLVSPELATCDDCLAELFNPNDRRFRYPFINCTNCGPRFTIIERLPYDRAETSMRDFKMCARCSSEYADPLDRRFHAQPDACFDCGPHVTFAWRQAAGASLALPVCRQEGDLLISQGFTREDSDAIFAQAVELLRAGGILAVKGLGGFHLACNANNAEAVARLRARKRREGKAFAVMMASVDDVRVVCEVNEVEERVLTGAQRPIVLLRKRADVRDQLAPQLADGLSELGVMLPYTPVQHLLMHDFVQACAADGACAAAGGAGVAGEAGGARADGAASEVANAAANAACATGAQLPPMLVMTSGNLHDEPIVVSDEEAYEKLSDVADAFLGNDRAILTRFDDSVVRVIRAGSAGYAVQLIRRARGYAPLPIPLARAGQAQQPSAESCAIFATGPEQKNTFALLRTGEQGANSAEVFVSQHIGDMENAETYDAWLAARRRFEGLFELAPSCIACDMHPEYLTSKWAHEQVLPVTEVQHHHAHVASVMAEHGLSDAVCGIAFDGTGFGVDGAIWGGEVMLANLQAFERFANFAYVPMPGAAAAIKHPLRMAYGVLWALDLLDHPAAAHVLERLGEQASICEAMIEQGLNTPMTSSVGRLFDAASALLGVCEEPTYEGEGACRLEALCSVRSDEASGQADAAASRGARSCRADEGSPAEVGSAFASTSISSTTETLADLANDASGKNVAASGEISDTDDAAAERYAVVFTKNTATATSTAQDTSVLLMDAASTFRALLDDLAAGVPTSVIARRFHDAIVGAIVQAAELVRALYGLSTVALSGGVFMNRYVVEHALLALEAAGFTVAINRDLPPNDGCISFGQAAVAFNSVGSRTQSG